MESLAQNTERVQEAEVVQETEPLALPMVAEPQYQYGAEAFEAYQKNVKVEQTAVQETKTPEVKSKSR